MLTQNWSLIFLRLALGASFLSAVADRFGLWGQAGARGVAWGNFQAFQEYTASLNWFVPAAVVPALAWSATILEIVLGICLIIGFRLKLAALGSGLLLSLFFLAMSTAFGPKPPLDYSVFTAAAASFYMYSQLKARR